MPRFTGQNKKRINPRYFINETRQVDEFKEGDIPEEQLAEEESIELTEEELANLTEEELIELFGFGKKNKEKRTAIDPKSGKEFEYDPLIADPENRDASGKVQPSASDMRRARKRGYDDAKRIFGR